MSETRRREVRLKTTFGFPCISPKGSGVERSAVWCGDDVFVLRRVGSHYLCYVSWNRGRCNMLAWLHKRTVRNRTF